MEDTGLETLQSAQSVSKPEADLVTGEIGEDGLWHGHNGDVYNPATNRWSVDAKKREAFSELCQSKIRITGE